MAEWRTIDSAPKDGKLILVYGQPVDFTITATEGTVTVMWGRSAVHAAGWDDIDCEFNLDGGTWLGPFIKPTHWMPLPDPPVLSAPSVKDKPSESA